MTGGNVFERAQNGAKQIILGKTSTSWISRKPVTWETGRQVYDYQLEAGSKKYLFEIKTDYDVAHLITTLITLLIIQ